MRRTKIVCTLGPAVQDRLNELISEGMDAARFNFSHGTHESHAEMFARLEKARSETGRYIAAILDTKGPEIRLKQFKNGKIDLHTGDSFTLTTRDVEGTQDIISITYADLPKDLKNGDRVLIDDGLVALKVDSLTDTDIVCTVLNDGTISDNKGVNVPDTKLSMPFISTRDRSDIVFGIEKGFDFIAASFVRSADDVRDVRKLLNDNNCTSIKIISKIENAQGVANIDEIIEASDGIMVARGDMGVEIPFQEVPSIQKMIIKKVNRAGKLVITATQMLDSMIKNPRPTRAEATDVANAIYDGTGAIMLSGETAAGKYPIEAVKTMVNIADYTESDINYWKRFITDTVRDDNINITEAISHSACLTAMDLEARAIIGVSKTGNSVRGISKFHPSCPIIGCSTFSYVCRQMNLMWGVIPMLISEKEEPMQLFEYAVEEAEGAGYIRKGDLTVMTAGMPLGRAGTTNMIRVHRVGDDYN